MLSPATINGILDAIRGKSIGLVGDIFLDRYFDIRGQLDEPSVETGLTAYQITRVRNYPGALGTVLNNLVALGVGRIVPFSILGDDGEAFELRKILSAMLAVDCSYLVNDSRIQTPTYAKPMRDGEELNRFDTKNRTPTPRDLIDAIITNATRVNPTIDAWIVLDQVSERDCGVVTAPVREWCRNIGPSKFVLADSRERIGEFDNVWIKPNEREAVNLDLRHRRAFVTMGERGLRLIDHGRETLVSAFPVDGPIDICGAGDSCSAGIACAIVAGCTPLEAAAFGNLVASITIQQIGVTGTATPDQVRQRAKVLRIDACE